MSCRAELGDRCRDEKIGGGGEVGCACSMAVLTGLWYFSKECGSMCVSQKTCSHFSWDCAGVCD